MFEIFFPKNFTCDTPYETTPVDRRGGGGVGRAKESGVKAGKVPGS